MKLQRRTLNLMLAAALALGGAALDAQAQGRKDSVVLGMVLEPAPGLDPTTAPAAAIGEIVHYNILEGLTKINVDGTVTPLLAESWQASPDGKTYTFKLRKGIKFQDGEPFDAAAVKFSFERAKADGLDQNIRKDGKARRYVTLASVDQAVREALTSEGFSFPQLATTSATEGGGLWLTITTQLRRRGVKIEATLGLPVLGAIALLGRGRSKPIDVGLGPEPLINNIYHKRALTGRGYRAETFVSSVSFITGAFDVRGDRRLAWLPSVVLRAHLVSLLLSARVLANNTIFREFE